MQVLNFIIPPKNTNISSNIKNENIQGEFKCNDLNNENKQNFIFAFLKASVLKKHADSKEVSCVTVNNDLPNTQPDSNSSDPENNIISEGELIDNENTLKSVVDLSVENLNQNEQISNSVQPEQLILKNVNIDKSEVEKAQDGFESNIIKPDEKTLTDLESMNIALRNRLYNEFSEKNNIIPEGELIDNENTLKNSMDSSVNNLDEKEQIPNGLQKQLISGNIDGKNNNLNEPFKKVFILSDENSKGHLEKKDILFNDIKIGFEAVKSESAINHTMSDFNENRVDLKLLDISEAHEFVIDRLLRKYISGSEDCFENTKNLNSELTAGNRASDFQIFNNNINYNYKGFDFELLTELSEKIDFDNKNNEFMLLNSSNLGKANFTGVSSTHGELFPKALSDDVLFQVVSKTVTGAGNGQSTIKINLKPEHLGRLNLTISIDNNQVVIKILTEMPLVKEIIESNIAQLKTDLGSQGLEVNRLDVFIPGDLDHDAREYGNNKNYNMKSTRDGFDKDGKEEDEEETESSKHVQEGKGINLIGVFA